MTASKPRVAIVGAGVSGLCAGIRLKHHLGDPDTTIFERCDDVGGTWHLNHYPGAACDVPSMFYSFSFNQNPKWTQHYSPQAEINTYLQNTAKKFGLYPCMQFRTEFLGAQWDEGRQVWKIQTAPIDDLACVKQSEAEFLILSSAALNRPAIPDFPGLSSFKGPIMHTSRWEDSFDPTGKRVAVIGTGASAVQVVPTIAPQTKSLTVFQRTPGWAVGRGNFHYPQWLTLLFTWFPLLMWLYRTFLFLARDFVYFPAFKQGSFAEKIIERLCRKHLEVQVPDPKLRELLTPNFPPGCKRLLVTDDYLPSLSLPHVQLETSGIAKVDESGIVTQDGKHHPCDAIVMATGFQVTSFLSHLNIVGRGGQSLSSRWKSADDVEAYYGTMITGCPNMFVLMGPNTALGHSSMIFIIETQVEYICKLLKQMRSRHIGIADVRPVAQRTYNAWIQKDLSKTVWAGGCQSWYKTASGKIVTLWPHSTIRFWWIMRNPKLEDMELFAAKQQQ